MKAKEFADKHGLTRLLGIDSENKVELGYFKHNVEYNKEKYEVVTLSRDFSLFISNLGINERRAFLKAVYDEMVTENVHFIHLVHQSKHLLFTLVGSPTSVVTFHVEQRA